MSISRRAPRQTHSSRLWSMGEVGAALCRLASIVIERLVDLIKAICAGAALVTGALGRALSAAWEVLMQCTAPIWSALSAGVIAVAGAAAAVGQAVAAVMSAAWTGVVVPVASALAELVAAVAQSLVRCVEALAGGSAAGAPRAGRPRLRAASRPLGSAGLDDPKWKFSRESVREGRAVLF